MKVVGVTQRMKQIEVAAKLRKEINTISGQKSRIAKVKNSVTLHPGQGAWGYLEENQGQVNGDDFIFPILFNTIVEKNLFASKFSPRAGVFTCNLHD